MKSKWMAMTLAAAVLPWTARAEEKVAVCDAARVMKEFYKTRIAEDRMDDQVKEFNTERDKMMEEHTRLKKEFEAARADAQKKDGAEKVQSDKKDAAEEKLLGMVEFEDKIRETILSRRKQIEEQKYKMQKMLVDEIGETVQKVARAKSCTLVLDASSVGISGFRSVLFSAGSLDITGAVVDQLNKDAPAGADKGGKDPAKGPGKDKADSSAKPALPPEK